MIFISMQTTTIATVDTTYIPRMENVENFDANEPIVKLEKAKFNYKGLVQYLR